MFLRVAFILLLTISSYAFAEKIPFKNVKSVGYLFPAKCNKHITVKEVDVSPCGNVRGKGCGVTGGVETTLKIKFDTHSLNGMPTDKLKYQICGWKVFCLPLPLKNDNACNGKGLNCPLAENASHEFSITLPIPSYYPKIRVKTEIRLFNGDKYLACVIIPLQVL